jgi:hypothetical protein
MASTTPSSSSSTSLTTINYYKQKSNTNIEEYLEKTCKVSNVQKYNSIYSLFFDLNEKNYNRISLNHRYQFKTCDSVLDIKTNKIKSSKVFIKYSPLLDPLKYMVGKYNLADPKLKTLPQINNNDESHMKLQSIYNASYVDCFFNYLSSTLLNNHGCFNAIDFYGSFLGIQERFRMNIEDDIEYLSGSPFFTNNLGKIMTLENQEMHPFLQYGNDSKKRKIKLAIANDEVELVIDELDGMDETSSSIVANDENSSSIETIFQQEISQKEQDEYTEDTYSNSDNSDEEDDNSVSDSEDAKNMSDLDSQVDENQEEDDEEDDADEYEETESGAGAVINIDNFPIQMICLEKCHGTLDELFVEDKVDEKNGIAFLFQVVMNLLAFQKHFSFTHNDLHTNNIMYMRTSEKYAWYKYNERVYRVPTYGYIFKIIDFGRSIYEFNGKKFCSDSFAHGGDGSTQYNFEPFYNPKKPKILPNYSFDLCRLACSIYDFLFDEQYDESKFDALQQLVFDWCIDDEGKNILYKGKKARERYPGFKLYKMIARKVHRHTPENQLERECFQAFLYNKASWKQKHNLMFDFDGSIEAMNTATV